MIDEKLYCETFSRLRASGEAKKEVLVKMNEMNEKRTMKRPLKALRVLAMAAMLTLALAVTANAASSGALFENLRIIWQDGSRIMLEDNQGNQVLVSGVYADAELRDGKLMLTVDGEEFDITADIEEKGVFSATVESADGRAVDVSVTGTLEDWEVVTSFEESDVDYNTGMEHTGRVSTVTKSCTSVTTSD
ncbi:MAG: hypothetical protein K2L38_04215 [Dysosmobacter sp.]|nr:hypothetical protein [Dysosmobacter sp.]